MSGASALVLVLFCVVVIAAPLAFYYLKIVPDLRRAEKKQFPERAVMRERKQLLAETIQPSRVMSFDCEGFENASDYEHLVQRFLAAVRPPVTIGFTCTVDGDRKRLEVTAAGQTFRRNVEHNTDWLDLEALLPLLNRALKVAGASGVFTTVELTSDQGAHVVYVSQDERTQLQRAGLRTHF